MSRAFHEEKVFTEQLDKALAGQAIQSEGLPEELSLALKFSQKILALRPDPRPQFQRVLRVNLIQKLREKEEHRLSRPWFWKGMPREPLWQTLVVLAMMIMVGGVLWSTLFLTGRPSVVDVPSTPPIATSAPSALPAPAAGVDQPQKTSAAPTYTSPVNRYLAAEGSTDKPIYQSGEQVKITVLWKNLTSQNLIIKEFPPLVSLMERADGRPVYTFSAGRSSRTLAPGESAGYTFTWDQRDARGNPASPGLYYVELEELYYDGQSVKMDLGQPFSFDIE